MSLPPFVRFTPVPVRARYDGWTPELQFRFIAALARGTAPGEAAHRLGMSRQTAYALRKRPGAESFAAAWDSALASSRRARRAGRAAPRAKVSVPDSLGRGDEAATEVLRARRAVAAPVRAEDDRRRAFSALLDRLYPRKPDKADKNDGADRQ